jgi:hypothetical protein
MRKVKSTFFGCWFLVALALPGFSRALGLNSSANQFNVAPDQFNVIEEGMGEAGAADGTFYNATAWNPALLANAPHLGEITLGFSVSNDLLTRMNYFTNPSNFNNLQNSFNNLGSSMQEITQGLQQATPNVTQINQGLTGVQGALTNLQAAAATLTDRTLQLGVGFNVALKFNDHWGFQVYNNTHGILQVTQEGLLTDLLNLAALPTLAGTTPSQVYSAASAFLGDTKQVLETAFPSQTAQLQTAVTTLQANQTSAGVTQFANTLSNIVSSVNQTAFQQAILNNIAEVTGLVYTDTVAMATYSFNPLEEETPLTVGVNLKVVNRRIGYINSTWLSQQNLNDASSISNGIKNDVDQSTFRWGLDLGLLYAFEDTGLSVGASAEDLIHSSATIRTQPGDPLYGVVTDPGPTVVRIGASWHPISEFTLNADLDDLFSSTSAYAGMDLTSHGKLGAAFNLLGLLQLRGGLSNSNWSGGLGIPILGLNYAYAVDDLTQSYNHYLSFTIAI